MPRLVHQPPKYSKHKASGQAVVTIAGEDVYLGAYGSRESRERYDRAVAEWLAGGRGQRPQRADRPDDPFTVARLVVQFWRHARSWYRTADGRTGEEAFHYRDALRPMVTLYGRTPAGDFGPLALKATREEMIRLGWCRTHINRQVLRIKHVFKWGVANELLKPATYDALRAVDGLRPGKTEAREPAKVKPVDAAHAEAVFSHLAPQVEAMIQLQAITGMRSTEVCTMRGCDIDTSAKPWKYRPTSHKTAHHGHERVIDLGPQARALVEKFLKPDVHAYLFDPRDGAAIRRRIRSEARRTPASCGNLPGSNRKRRPRRRATERYDRDSYYLAIARACDRAFPPPKHLARTRVPAAGRKHKATRWETAGEWRDRLGAEKWHELKAWQRAHRFHPHQLRHAAATRWRRQFGAEATLVLLGDRTTRMVDVYAEKDRATAAQIMETIG